MTNIKYYDGNVFVADAEISSIEAEERDFYTKVYLQKNILIKSEFIDKKNVTSVIYYNKDYKDSSLLDDHVKNYGNIMFQICNINNKINKYSQTRYYFSEDGKMLSYRTLIGAKEWDWDTEERFSPQGEKLETIKSIYDENGELIKEIHYKGDGSFWYEEDIERFD